MAKQLTPLGRLLVVVCGLSLVGYALYRYGVFGKIASVVAPAKKSEGTISSTDFGAPSTTASATTPGKPLSTGSRLNRPIRVAIVLWGGYAGGIMANNGMAPNRDSVFNKDFGVQVELLQIDDFVKSRDAFRAGGDKGGVDIMWSTVDAYALEYGGLSKLNPKAIMQYDWSRGGDAIAVDASIKSVADLRGKRLACAQETPSHYFALYVLAQGGLTSKDVNWVFTDSAVEAANVFKAGRVDAAVSWSPDVYVAARERQGGHILASTKEASNLIADIFVARGDFVEKYPEDVRRFVGGWLRGVEMVNKNPDRAAVLLQKSLTGVNTLEDAKAMLEDVKLPDFAENRGFFDPQGALVNYNTIYQTAQGIWRKIGKISDVYQPHQTVDTRFVEASAEWFPNAAATTASKSEFDFSKPAKTASTSILTKTVSIYFPTGSSSLDENAKAVLETQVVDLAATFGSAYLRIAGNTDNVGGREANVRLSRARADAVARFLVSKGFPANKFDVVGNGPDKPVASNDSDEGRAKNRRTDFEVVPPLMEVRGAVTRGRSRQLAAAGVAAFVGLWCLLSYGGIVPSVILPSLTDVVKALPVLHFEEALVRSAIASFYRVTMGFLLAAAVAIPLGIWMGTYPAVKRFFFPIMDPLRFLPISALVPLFIVWFGIDDMQKIAFLFVGTIVYLLPLVVEAVEGVEEVYLQTATTLGATQGQLIRHVLIPGSLPAIGEALRVMNGIGWTYVILAEVINAPLGLGALINVAGKRGHVDQIFALVLVILAIGATTDLLIRVVNKRLFAWAE